MTARFRMSRRRFLSLVAAGWFLAAALFCPAAFAQGPNDKTVEEAPSTGTGRPLDGYLGTLVLVGLAFFIVGKSARR